MTDPAQRPAWGAEGPARGAARDLQEHHEGWPSGQSLPAEPALVAEHAPGPLSLAGDASQGARPVRQAAGDPAGASPISGRDDRWAMASYLGAIFFWLLAPLAIYLAKRKSSAFIRSHAAQAFNLAVTVTLFAVSGGIVGGLLALNSLKYALLIMGPVLFAFWIVVLVYLIRAASSASRGEFYEIPGWLCVRTLR